MTPQHLYLIVPSEDATSISVDLRMIFDNSLMMKFGWQFSRVAVVKIGETNGKAALHLYFREDVRHMDWTELMLELMFNTESLDPLADIPVLETVMCLKTGVMICLDIEDLKERDPDFAVVTVSQDEDGNDVENHVLRDTVFA